MKGFALAILLALCGTAAADNFERPQRPYELQGVKLGGRNIPCVCTIRFSTGWQLKNGTKTGGHEYGKWFSCRIHVDPLTKTLTIETATEIDAP